MDSETLIRALFLAVGVLLGTYFGGKYNTNTKSVKRLIEVSEETNKMIHTLFDAKVSGNQEPPAKQFGWRPPLRRDEKGSISLVNLGVLFAIIVVSLSLFSTLSTNSKVAKTQEAQAQSQIISDRENACTSSVLFATVDAINQRTQYTSEQADANIELQKAQLQLLRTPPNSPPAVGQAALARYVRSLTQYIKVTSDAKQAAVLNPYPTKEEYTRCLSEARTKAVSDTTGGDR
jgi:hypothetical protein